VTVSAAVKDRTQVHYLRYAWANWPICSVYNSGRLPALQFWVNAWGGAVDACGFPPFQS
jgi:hypothetical protein